MREGETEAGKESDLMRGGGSLGVVCHGPQERQGYGKVKEAT